MLEKSCQEFFYDFFGNDYTQNILTIRGRKTRTYYLIIIINQAG